MTFSTTNHSLRHLTVAITAGVLALGLSGAVSAHGSGSDHRDGGYRSGHAAAEVHHHYYNESRRNHRGKHHHKHRRKHHHKHGGHQRGRHPRKVVNIHNYYDAPVEVVRVYEPRRRVVEHSIPQDTYGYERSRGSAQLNAGSLMGAAIGALIGSQIGGGKGKLAATAAGSVGGFVLGDHATRGYR